jgi:hypothetical protein
MSSSAFQSDSDELRQLCVTCVKLLDVTGAGISLSTGDVGGVMVAATDGLGTQVEEWQFSLGEGPCREAYTTNRPVMVDDLADGNEHVARWPVFADAARDAGILAMFAFPIGLKGSPLGVLDLFRDRVGPLSSERVGVAHALAELAATLLRPGIDYSAEDAADYRSEVHQAAGMVSVQLDVAPAEAMLRLRARAFANECTVSELALDVIARRTRFAREDL